MKNSESLLQALKRRFETNMRRHHGILWVTVEARIDAGADKLQSLHATERSGGEPDVVGVDRKTGELVFVDCSPQSPTGRRSLCYDGEALAARKEHKPRSSAVEMAAGMGVEILSVRQYHQLQAIGVFDTSTSSWVRTPERIRRLGGALFCDRRYDTVFVYHNGAESYYAARGFRCVLKV